MGRYRIIKSQFNAVTSYLVFVLSILISYALQITTAIILLYSYFVNRIIEIFFRK